MQATHAGRARWCGRPFPGNPPDEQREGAMTCCGTCNEEPALGDLLDDPIVVLLMTRDGVMRSEVERLMDECAFRSGTQKSQEAACACGPCSQ